MKKILVLGGLLLLILLGAAGYTLAQGERHTVVPVVQNAGEPGKTEKEIVIAVEENINGEVTAGEVTVTFADPPILPAERERALGVFLERQGGVLTLGTGSIEVEVAVEVVNDGDPVETVNITHSGDPVEVLVRSDSLVYKDITGRPEVTSADLETGRRVITRTVERGSLDELAEGMILWVWGEVQDGRVVADVLVYEQID